MRIAVTCRAGTLVTLLAVAGSVGTWPAKSSADAAAGGGYFSVQVENDLFGGGTDRFYTHGTELAYMRTGPAPGWLSAVVDVVPWFELTSETAVGYALGQQIFTPSDTRSSALVRDDRPYAGWLYFNASLGRRLERSADREVVDALSLTLGIVGPSSRAADIQREYHELIDVPVPQGWDNQLEDEPGLVLGYTRKWRFFEPAWHDTEWEFSPHVVGALGNVHTYAGLGVMARWGTGLRRDIGPPNIRPGFPGAPYFTPGGGWSWYLYGGVEGRLVARDIFLDGNTFKDSHSVDREPLVADFQFGIAVHIDKLRIAISNVERTREFRQQDEPTRYGAINVTLYHDW
jgi:hypothetical protein